MVYNIDIYVYDYPNDFFKAKKTILMDFFIEKFRLSIFNSSSLSYCSLSYWSMPFGIFSKLPTISNKYSLIFFPGTSCDKLIAELFPYEHFNWANLLMETEIDGVEKKPFLPFHPSCIVDSCQKPYPYCDSPFLSLTWVNGLNFHYHPPKMCTGCFHKYSASLECIDPYATIIFNRE